MLNLGQVQFGLGVDARSLGRAVQRVQAFGRAVERASRQQGRGADRISAAMRRQETSVTSALQRILRMNDQIRRSTKGNEQVQLLNRTRRAFIQLESQIARGPRTLLAFQRANESFGASLGQVQRRISHLRAEEAKRRQGQTQFGLLLRDLASASVLALGPLSGLGARIAALGAVASRSSLGLAALIGTAVGAGLAVAKLSQAAVRTALDIQRIEARLKSTTGSVEFASVEFDRLRTLAHDTGLEFVGLATQFTRFQAAAQGTSLEGNKAREIFDNLAFAVGNFQLEAVQAEGVFRAVEQIMSKGTVAAEEIRQQLGDRLPGAFKAAADAIGVTTAEFNKLLKSGKVASDQFLLPFSRQVRARLAGDAGNAVDSLRATINRFTNALTFFNDAFDKTFGISAAFKASLQAATSVVNFLSRNILTLTGVVGGLAGGFTILALPRIIGAFRALAGAVTGAVAAFIGLNTALTVGTLGSIVTVAVRLAAVLGGAALAIYTLGNASAEAATKEAELTAKTDALIESQEQANTTVAESANIFQKAAQAKLAAIKSELQAQEQQLASYRDILKEQLAQNEALAKMHANSQAFISAIRSASGDITAPRDVGTSVESGALKRIEDLNEAIVKQQERIKKLDEIETKASTNFGLGESADRATKAIREANQQIERLHGSIAAMQEGPVAFKLFEEQAEINKKISDMHDRLVDAEVPLDTVRAKIAQYTLALQTHNEISKGVFKDMTATYDAFKNIAVSGFQSMADSVAQAIVDGELSAQTFVDVFKNMVKRIIAETLKLAVINPILNSIFGAVGGQALPVANFGAIGFAKGGAFDQGQILKTPTPFMTNSGPAVAGEKGPEAVLPLVMGSQGLGIRAYTGSTAPQAPFNAGNQSNTGPTNIYVTFQTPDANSFMKSRSQVSALMAGAVQRGHRNM